MTYSGYSTGEQGNVGIATSWKPETAIAAPSAPTGATATTGGTVLPGTYLVEVSYVNANGETQGSAQLAEVVPAGTNTNTLTVHSPGAETGATGYYAYVSQAGGSSLTRQQAPGTPTAIGTDLTLTAPPTTTGAPPSGVNTTAGDPNATVAPTSFIMAESVGLDSKPAMVEHNVYGADRDSDRGYRTGKYTPAGPLGFALYPTNGLELLVDAVGKDVYAAKDVTGDTTSAIVTANGVSTLTLVTGTIAFAPPQIVLVGAGAAQEIRPVISWDSGAKTLVVPELFGTHTGAGTTVNTLDRVTIQPYTRTDGYGNLLRRVSVEENVGNKYAQSYPGGMVAKWAIKGAATKMDVTVDLVFLKQRSRLSTPSAFVEDDSWDELSYEFTDGFMVFPSDPLATGVATVQLVADGEDWGITIDNKMVVKNPFDGTEVVKQFPTTRQVDITFQMMNQSDRPVMWEDFMAKNLDLPWMSFAALNVGTSSVPSWQAMLFYAPSCRVTGSTELRNLNDVIGENVTVRARKANGLEKLYVVATSPEIAAAL